MLIRSVPRDERTKPIFYSNLKLYFIFSLTVKPGDPNFVGAWWIGYVISAGIVSNSLSFNTCFST